MSDTRSPLAVAAVDMTARDVLRALYVHFGQRYAVLGEVSTGEDEPTEGSPWPRDRRCDALLINKTERINVEIKVSRADFLNDVKRPEKQAAWNSLTHRRAYAVPFGLVCPDEVPEGFGLMEVVGQPGRLATVTWTRRAPKIPGHAPAELPARVMYALMHRLANAEAHMKGHAYHQASEDPSELRARIKHLEGALDKERNRCSREREQRERWQRLYGAANPVPCSTCGQRLLLASARRYGDWKHAPADERVCHPLREAAAREQYGAGRDRVYVPGPVPVEVLPEAGDDRG